MLVFLKTGIGCGELASIILFGAVISSESHKPKTTNPDGNSSDTTKSGRQDGEKKTKMKTLYQG